MANGFETILSDNADSAIQVEAYDSGCDCYDCDYNCDECDGCDCDTCK